MEIKTPHPSNYKRIWKGVVFGSFSPAVIED